MPAGSAQAVEDLFFVTAEQLGQDPVDDDAGEADGRLGGHPAGQLERLGDRHLLGRRHRDEAGPGRVGEDVEHPVGLGADEADLDEVVDGLGGGELADDVAGGRRVDDDEVVVALADLVAELADGQDLPDARRGGGDEVERLGQRPDPADDRDLQVELEVLAQRRLGVHRHGEDAGRDLALGEPGRRGLEERREVALGVDLAGQHPLPALGGQLGQRGGDRRLADAALAGDEDQPAGPRGRGRSPPRPPGRRTGHGRRGSRREGGQGAPNPTRRSLTGAPTST